MASGGQNMTTFKAKGLTSIANAVDTSNFIFLKSTTLTADQLGNTVSLSLNAAAVTGAAMTNHSLFLNAGIGSGLGTPFQLQIPDSSHLYIYKRWYTSGAWSGWSKVSAGHADDAAKLLDSAHSWTATEVYNYMTARVLKAGDTMTGQLYINYSQDVGLNQNGSLIIGPKGGENIGIDGNEIMARNNSAASTLYINSEGGNVYIGSGGVTSVGTITSSAGYLKSTANGNTITIGSQNTGFAHIQSSANIPFYFNRTTLIDGDLGNTSYPVKNITMGKANGAGIYYQGSKANYRMIRFIDNASDNYGNGISIGGGGQTIIGGGESADTAAAQAGTAGAEIMQVCNDGNVEFISNLQNGWDNRKVMTLNTSGYLLLPSYINVPTSNNENPTVSQFIVTNGSDHYYRKASTAHAMAAIRGAASGSWGISVTGSSTSCTGNAATATKANGLADGSSTMTSAYNKAGLNYGDYTWLAGWNGYELRAVNKSQFAQASHSHNEKLNQWFATTGSTNAVIVTHNSTGSDSGRGQCFAFGNGNGTPWFTEIQYGSTYVRTIRLSNGMGATSFISATQFAIISSSWDGVTVCQSPNSSGAITAVAGAGSSYSANGTNYRAWIEGNSVTGAVWNDYAENREAINAIPGQCVYEIGDDTLKPTEERLSHFAGIVSDTWGFSQGETETAKSPIAVAGRVLAYTYRCRDEYKPGDVLCAAPGGTVDIMTREEIQMYPDRIVGTVSCVPDYETWGGGEMADREPVEVDGRIWVKVK